MSTNMCPSPFEGRGPIYGHHLQPCRPPELSHPPTLVGGSYQARGRRECSRGDWEALGQRRLRRRR
ncbi:hypothetical protein M413DRAFT_447325 [Hebeloma cylindrosporum]|uniref:Uncharacterized protein n=1 Tax=Hebeloma cylindrosporum TaxID=76867 RepID=A0A0C3C5T0_HEBCY|nr:hypothetical protein M413DRAFT_447325 [Hebeloma cylindrosporum h7]